MDWQEPGIGTARLGKHMKLMSSGMPVSEEDTQAIDAAVSNTKCNRVNV